MTTPNAGSNQAPARGQGRTRPPRRAPFPAVVVAVLGVGLIGQLALNTSLQHGSFEYHTLASDAARLAEQRQELEQELAAQEDPSVLAAKAAVLGMVASENPVFIRLADGGVSGTPVEATAPPPPPPTTPAATTPATAPPTTAPPSAPQSGAPAATTSSTPAPGASG